MDNKPRFCPPPRHKISSVKDLDLFFGNLASKQWLVKEWDFTAGISSDSLMSIPLSNLYCYVSLEFVQAYYLEHLMPDENDSKFEYDFTAVENIPGVYKVHAQYNHERNA